MFQRQTIQRTVQALVVILAALLLKHFYSIASPDELQWILAPTTFLVHLITGASFSFESHAGYITADHGFLIAGSCAGVNFLITSFLMLMLSRLWKHRSGHLPWSFIPWSASLAYVATLLANAVRISTALHVQQNALRLGTLNPSQLHRLEGIAIYFGFLLLLYTLNERKALPPFVQAATACSSLESAVGASNRSRNRGALFPLVIYYATTLAIPLANGAYRNGPSFLEHALFVLFTPLALVLPFAAFRYFQRGLMHLAPTRAIVSSGQQAVGCQQQDQVLCGSAAAQCGKPLAYRCLGLLACAAMPPMALCLLTHQSKQQPESRLLLSVNGPNAYR